MSATWNWSGTYGTSPGTTTDLGVSGNLFNFKSVDSLTSAADYTSYPITAGNNSYEVFLRGHWSGTFNQIQNVQFYKSAGVLSGGIDIKWDGETTAYSTPVSSASTIATSDIPTADPGTANVSIGGALTGSLTAAGFSDQIVLQMMTTTAASAGDTPTCKSMGRDTVMCSGNLVNSEDTSKETIPSQQDRNIWACVETRDQAPLLERVESIVRTIWQHIELAGNMLVCNLSGL